MRNGVPSRSISGLSVSKPTLGGRRFVPQGGQHLDDAGHAGSTFEVADVGFHRADAAASRRRLRPCFRCPLAERGLQPRDLDGIAERRAGSMGLDVAHGIGAYPGIAMHLRDEIGLRVRIGHGQRAGAPAMIGADASDDRMDGIAVCSAPGPAASAAIWLRPRRAHSRRRAHRRLWPYHPWTACRSWRRR